MEIITETLRQGPQTEHLKEEGYRLRGVCRHRNPNTVSFAEVQTLQLMSLRQILLKDQDEIMAEDHTDCSVFSQLPTFGLTLHSYGRKANSARRYLLKATCCIVQIDAA